jgi:hypothetical protein
MHAAEPKARARCEVLVESDARGLEHDVSSELL